MSAALHRKFSYNDRVTQTDESLHAAPSPRDRMTARVIGYPYADERIVEVHVDGDNYTSIWAVSHWELAALTTRSDRNPSQYCPPLGEPVRARPQDPQPARVGGSEA